MFYMRTADRLQRTSTWRDNLEGGLDYLKAVVVEDGPAFRPTSTNPVPPTRPLSSCRCVTRFARSPTRSAAPATPPQWLEKLI
jgi:NAD(P)H-nitrite reductase large subunit